MSNTKCEHCNSNECRSIDAVYINQMIEIINHLAENPIVCCKTKQDFLDGCIVKCQMTIASLVYSVDRDTLKDDELLVITKDLVKQINNIFKL